MKVGLQRDHRRSDASFLFVSRADLLPSNRFLRHSASLRFPQEARERLELLLGTLDLLILRTLIFGPQHAQGIARTIQQTSEEELLVEHEVKLMDFTKWLEKTGGSPREVSDRYKIRSILGMPVSR